MASVTSSFVKPGIQFAVSFVQRVRTLTHDLSIDCQVPELLHDLFLQERGEETLSWLKMISELCNPRKLNPYEWMLLSAISVACKCAGILSEFRKQFAPVSFFETVAPFAHSRDEICELKEWV
jgi:hypothetical protein